MNERSKQVRRDIIELSSANGGYHYGGCFSCVEILIALFDHIKVMENWEGDGGDRFILSKGHACWGYYVLLREQGFRPKLEGHPVRDEHNGVFCSTGSMGHGFPTGVGMAMTKKTKDRCGRVFVLMGDGECQEGTTWESLLIAAKYKLDNLIVIVDWNRIQGSDFVGNILSILNIDMIVSAIGWDCIRINGHDIEGICNLGMINKKNGLPKFVVAETTKGKGVSFMKNKPEWHAKWLGGEEKKLAMEELI